MATIIYGKKPFPSVFDPSCLAPPPEYECPPIDYCEPLSTCCPAKTKVRDAYRIYNNEAERCFLLQGTGCKREPIPMTGASVVMHVRRRGECKELIAVHAYKLQTTGAACWRWTPEFLNLAEGYYEGEIKVNGKGCHVVGLYFPPCIGRPASTDVVYASACPTTDPTCCPGLEVDQTNTPSIEEGCATC